MAGTALSFQEWTKYNREGVPVELPSGLVAQIKPVSTELFLKSGVMPDYLTSAVGRLIGGNIDAKSMMEGDPVENYLKMIEVANLFMETCIVNPKIVRGEPQNDGEVSLDWFADDDKLFVLSLMGRPARQLLAFRTRQEGTVESVQPVEGEPDSSE